MTIKNMEITNKNTERTTSKTFRCFLIEEVKGDLVLLSSADIAFRARSVPLDTVAIVVGNNSISN
jgi:hypothetical protein